MGAGKLFHQQLFPFLWAPGGKGKDNMPVPRERWMREGVNDRRNPKKMWTLTACRTFSQELVSFLTAATNLFLISFLVAAGKGIDQFPSSTTGPFSLKRFGLWGLWRRCKSSSSPPSRISLPFVPFLGLGGWRKTLL